MKLSYSPQPSPLLQRRENIRRALLALHLFGHLRHTDLARLLWPASSASTRDQAASRLFSHLVRERFILRRINAFGTYSYVLGLRGAIHVGRSLDEGSRDGSVIAGIQGRTFFHRTLASTWLLDQLNQGNDVLTEFAINSNRYPITRQALTAKWRKLPDGLVLHQVADEGEEPIYLADWLETESTYKSLERRQRIMDMIWVLGRQLVDGQNVYLDRMVLLYTKDSGHEAMLVKSAALKWKEHGHQIANPKELLGSVLMVRADASPPLSVKSFETIDLYTLMVNLRILIEDEHGRPSFNEAVLNHLTAE